MYRAMSKGAATRTGIVDEALRQASVYGLEGISLGPLANALRMSKSGLFAHFRSKEALQIEVVETAIARFKDEVLRPGLACSDPVEELEVFFSKWLTWIRSVEDYGGCVFMTLAQEYDDRPGVIRERLAQSQKDMRKHLASIVRRGMKQGVFRADADPVQWVFELYGVALSFQHAANLLNDGGARKRALVGMRRLMEDIRNQGRSAASAC
jgi:AcrR family transcriptional regulator